MAVIDRRDFERLRYWQGQTLRSRDYRDQSRFDARRRHLHNRALHGVDGVSFGLAVTRLSDPVWYEISCGLAYDCSGREILIQQPRRIAPPGEPSWLIARLRPASQASSCCAPSDPGCLPDDARLLDRDVELVWDPIGSIVHLNGVALASATPEGLDSGFRPRQARPLARPRLARGQTVRGNTPWEPWAIDEPDGRGGTRKRVVGVETHIDTSAAGFTSTPRYFASIDSPAWDLATAEFAPAFFPHVADPAADKFTFRLLMVETARRRYNASFGTGRVTTTTRGVGDRLLIEVDEAGAFRKGDMISLLRPRARSIVRVEHASGVELTLSAALEADAAVAGTTVLAVGNMPRMAVVSQVMPEDSAVLAAFASPGPIRKNDVLLRTADRAITVVDSVQQGKLSIGHPFAGWNASDPVMVARQSSAVDVKNASLSADGLKMLLELKPATHAIDGTLTIVLLDAQKAPFAGPRTVTKRSGANIEVEPPLTAADIAGLKRVAPFVADVTIQGLQPKNPGMVVKVDSAAPFAEGDFVAAADAASAITTVEKVTGPKELVLGAALPLKPGSVLVAADWLTATSVNGVGVTGPNDVLAGRENTAPPGSFVTRRVGNGFSSPSVVKTASGATLTLAMPIAGLARLDTLAVGVFPRVATVMAQQAQEEQVQVVEAGALVAGDHVAVLADVATRATVAQVVSASGASVVLSESLGKLSPGQKLAVVHFRDTVLLSKVDAADDTSIEIDRDVELRDGDIIGALTHYADNSTPGLIESIQGNHLTLSVPGVEHGDGIVSAGWIDGGIVGPAAVSYLSLSQLAIPSQFQPVVRLVAADGFNQSQPAVAYGFDLLSGRYVSSAVLPFLYDAAGRHVYVVPVNLASPYRYRPETLSLITTFNTDFPRAFATFAQKQGLSVSWIGCQDALPGPSGCPAQRAQEPCADPDSR